MTGDQGKTVVEVSSLTKRYGNLRALDSVNLTIPYGPVGLLGPNGAGKSTLIKCLLGLANPTSGSTRILGFDSRSLRGRIGARENIGYVPENECLIPDMDAVSFVRYMGEISGLPPMDAMQRAHEVLHYVGIGDERYREIETYSTGMRQKVKLAQALVHDPKLIILDEPTNGMDPKGREEMLDLIRDISQTRKKNILLSSHLLPDVEYICDNVVIMDQGKIIVQGSISELTAAADRFEIRIKGNEKVFLEILDEMGLDFERRGSFFIVRTEDEILPDLYERIMGKEIEIRHAARSKLTLEEIFVRNIEGRKVG